MRTARTLLYITLGVLAAAVVAMTTAWFFTHLDGLIFASSTLAIAFLVCFPFAISVNNKLQKSEPSVAMRLRRQEGLFVHVYPYGRRYIAALYTMSEVDPFAAWLAAGSETDEYDCLGWAKVFYDDIRITAGKTVFLPKELFEKLHADARMKDFFRKNKVVFY